MIHTTKDKLKKIFKKASEEDIDAFYKVFSSKAEAFGVKTEVQENFFLAQIVAETGYDLKPKRENLNYSVSALKSIFKRYRNNPKWAERDGYIKRGREYIQKANKVNIGNIAYANRIGNGDINSGDGYRFRGGGYFQLTGRENYEKMTEVINKVLGKHLTPELLEAEINTIEVSTLTALAFWYTNKCYECDHIDCVTKKINRYTDSYEKRKEIYMWIAGLA